MLPVQHLLKKHIAEYGPKSAKQKEMAAAKEQSRTNKQDLADTKAKLAADKEDLEDRRAALASDEAFLADLKSKCADMDKVWEERSKMRADETTAIAETIKILDADEAHDTFSKSLGFVQLQRRATARTASRRA